MKISMITTLKFPYTTGAPIRVLKEAEYLGKRKYDLNIITTDFSSKEKQVFGIPITRTKNLLKIKKELEKADIVHAHNLEGAMIAGLCKAPYLFDVHGFMFLEYPHLIQKKGLAMKFLRTRPMLSLALRMIRHLFDKAVNNSICLVPCADSMNEYFIKKYNKKTFNCSMGYNDVFLKLKGFNPDTVIYTGNFYSWQNIGLTIKAFNKLEKGNYLIVGDGDQREHLKNLAKSERIRFVGRVEYEKITDYLDNAGIGLSPRTDEKTSMVRHFFPTKLVDYMAAGKAVIGVNIGEQGGIIKKSQCGAALPNNVDLWAETMQRFLEKPRKTRKMGLKGRNYVKEKFNWNNILKNLEKAYEYCMENEV